MSNGTRDAGDDQKRGPNDASGVVWALLGEFFFFIFFLTN